jgi:hypothetical protein
VKSEGNIYIDEANDAKHFLGSPCLENVLPMSCWAETVEGIGLAGVGGKR